MRPLLRWIRRRRPLAAALLLACLCSGPFVVPHADAVGDAACAPALAQHDAAAHRFSASPVGHDDHAHCFACHLVRSFSCLLRTAALDRSLDRPERLYSTDSKSRIEAPWTLIPGRAPPA